MAHDGGTPPSTPQSAWGQIAIAPHWECESTCYTWAVRLRLLILLILLCAAPPLHAAEYDIAAVYDDTQHQIAGVANISFTNAGDRKSVV